MQGRGGECLIRPRSIAIVGASTSGSKAGGRRWLSSVDAGFSGPLYPVNRTVTEMNGYQVYRSLSDIPGPIDLVAILVPSEGVMACIRECAEKQVGAAVIISAGFGEVDAAGKAAETEMRRILDASGVRMIGPNSAGVFSARGRVNLLGRPLPEGPISIVTQSGNMAGTFAQQARDKGLGFANLIAIGNGAGLTIGEAVDLLQDDPQTRAILVYCEGFRPGEGRDLFERMRSRAAAKPVVMLKAGSTETGKRAALSHTGALAGEDEVVDAALLQCGIIRALESEAAWDAATALATCPALRGRSLAIVSDGGGHATIVADCVARLGLQVPPFGAETRERLGAVLPTRSSTENPVDFAGVAESDPDRVGEVVRICCADPAIAGVIFAGHFGGYFKMTGDPATRDRISRAETDAAGRIAALPGEFDKPIIFHSEYAEEALATLDPLRTAKIPLVRALEAPPRMMAALHRHAQGRPQAAMTRLSDAGAGRVANPVLASRQADSGPAVLEPEARTIAEAYGVPVSPYRVIAARAELDGAMGAFDGRVAVKLIAPQAIHKSDIGGVILDVDRNNVAAAFDTLAARAREIGAVSPRFLLTAMITGGTECIIGAKRDAQFGPIVMFGLGGIFVEAIAGAAFRIAPIGNPDAVAMIEHSAAARLLHGLRGRKPADIDSLAACIVRVSEMIHELEQVEEIDLNPVFALEGGAVAADCRMILRQGHDHLDRRSATTTDAIRSIAR